MGDHILECAALRQAEFIERPNRFLIRCHSDEFGEIEAFLPNPGRLRELLLPRATLYLTRRSGPDDSSSGRKTQFTVLAVQRDGSAIFLHTHLCNTVARLLIERQRIPDLAGAKIVRSEVPVGNSRFDFLLRMGRRQVYLEVKSCTLFGNGVAMFPDAVTERGKRHLIELACLSRRGARSIVLFLVHTPAVQWFMPDFHTDLAFSQTLLNLRNKLRVLPVAIEWSHDLTLGQHVTTLEVPWKHLQREVRDRGSYLLLLQLKQNKRIEVGRLGHLRFRSGYYLYVGSAMRNLTARVARHLRTRKKLHWHIDYLRQVASQVHALPIRASQRLECDIAHSLSAIVKPGPTGFGSSDCDCHTHLFWNPTNPLDWQEFHVILQQFRTRTFELRV